MDHHLFNKWLAVAARTADLPKLSGGLWHPYRRKWATYLSRDGGIRTRDPLNPMQDGNRARYDKT